MGAQDRKEHERLFIFQRQGCEHGPVKARQARQARRGPSSRALIPQQLSQPHCMPCHHKRQSGLGIYGYHFPHLIVIPILVHTCHPPLGTQDDITYYLPYLTSGWGGFQSSLDARIRGLIFYFYYCYLDTRPSDCSTYLPTYRALPTVSYLFPQPRWSHGCSTVVPLDQILRLSSSLPPSHQSSRSLGREDSVQLRPAPGLTINPLPSSLPRHSPYEDHRPHAPATSNARTGRPPVGILHESREELPPWRPEREPPRPLRLAGTKADASSILNMPFIPAEQTSPHQLLPCRPPRSRTRTHLEHAAFTTTSSRTSRPPPCTPTPAPPPVFTTSSRAPPRPPTPRAPAPQHPPRRPTCPPAT